jgi:hypothetical protein
MLKSFSFRLPSGFRFTRRAIGFLESTDGELDAGSVYDGLNGKVLLDVSTRFDHWLQGNVYDKYFHGFSDEHRDCFTFKWHVKRQEHRFYGFLCNPRPQTDAGFRICVLVYSVPKNEWETDLSVLARILRLQFDLRVAEAIAKVYPEFKGLKSWKT